MHVSASASYSLTAAPVVQTVFAPHHSKDFGVPCKRGKPCIKAMSDDGVDFDALDRIVRPPATAEEEIQAYWEYLLCSTWGCNGWLWRRHITDPNWGIRCYVCRRSWRETYLQNGFWLWDPINKRMYEPSRGLGRY